MSSEELPVFFPVSSEDLLGLQTLPEQVLKTLAGKRILITGGTGFVGSWLLEALLYANRLATLKLQIFVLTRNVDRWRRSRPHLAADPAIFPMTGDILTPQAWEHELPATLDLLIHGAFDSGLRPGIIPRLQVFESILEGTQHVVSAAIRRSTQRVLFLSSGAVYGPMPPNQTMFSEDTCCGPDPMAAQAAYAEGKRAAEAWGAAFCEQHSVEFISGRLFAFAGPYLPLNQHFAFGNFLRYALNHQTIRVAGTGETVLAASPCMFPMCPELVWSWKQKYWSHSPTLFNARCSIMATMRKMYTSTIVDDRRTIAASSLLFLQDVGPTASTHLVPFGAKDLHHDVPDPAG